MGLYRDTARCESRRSTWGDSGMAGSSDMYDFEGTETDTRRQSNVIDNTRQKTFTTADEWVQCTTSEGHIYYYNNETCVSTWDSPYTGSVKYLRLNNNFCISISGGHSIIILMTVTFLFPAYLIIIIYFLKIISC